MKKITIVLLMVFVICCGTACGNENNTEGNVNSQIGNEVFGVTQSERKSDAPYSNQDQVYALQTEYDEVTYDTTVLTLWKYDREGNLDEKINLLKKLKSKTAETIDALLYVNDEELIFSGYDDEGIVSLWSLPVKKEEKKDRVLTEQFHKIADIVEADMDYDKYGLFYNLYANSDYIIFSFGGNVANYDTVKVYDRRKKEFVVIENLPEIIFFHSVEHSVFHSADGDRVILMSGLENESPYKLWIYKLGDTQLKEIENLGSEYVNSVAISNGSLVIYPMPSDEGGVPYGIRYYDYMSGEKKDWIATEQLHKVLTDNNLPVKKYEQYAIYVDGERLYVFLYNFTEVDTVVLSCPLANETKLVYEKQLSDNLKDIQKRQRHRSVAAYNYQNMGNSYFMFEEKLWVLNGKILYTWVDYQIKSTREKVAEPQKEYIIIDLNTKETKVLEEDAKERVFFDEFKFGSNLMSQIYGE